MYEEPKIESPKTSDADIVDKKEEEPQKKELKLTVLGEMQFGGVTGKSLSQNYMLATKEVSEYTKNSDYVMATLGTNILRSDEVNDNIQSKYIVSKQVINAFSALNINGLNIATDHMLDFKEDVFKVTKGILEEEDINILGIDDSVIYVENDGIKIAIVGVLNEVIGRESDYTKVGIYMYNLKALEQKISDLKEKVNTVIVMTHLGYENVHTVTKVMSWFYKELIDMGADLVLGSHSLGVYPVEIYKGKPILYSLGYFISDTSYELGKKSGIFNFTFDDQGDLTKIEMIPTYIKDKKEVKLYNDLNEKEALSFMQMFSANIVNKQITSGRVILNLK